MQKKQRNEQELGHGKNKKERREKRGMNHLATAETSSEAGSQRKISIGRLGEGK